MVTDEGVATDILSVRSPWPEGEGGYSVKGRWVGRGHGHQEEHGKTLAIKVWRGEPASEGSEGG